VGECKPLPVTHVEVDEPAVHLPLTGRTPGSGCALPSLFAHGASVYAYPCTVHTWGLTLIHFSAQPEPALIQKHTSYTPSTPLSPLNNS